MLISSNSKSESLLSNSKTTGTLSSSSSSNSSSIGRSGTGWRKHRSEKRLTLNRKSSSSSYTSMANLVSTSEDSSTASSVSPRATVDSEDDSTVCDTSPLLSLDSNSKMTSLQKKKLGSRRHPSPLLNGNTYHHHSGNSLHHQNVLEHVIEPIRGSISIDSTGLTNNSNTSNKHNKSRSNSTSDDLVVLSTNYESDNMSSPQRKKQQHQQRKKVSDSQIVSSLSQMDLDTYGIIRPESKNNTNSSINTDISDSSPLLSPSQNNNSISDSRVEAQRQQILQNRQLQDKLRHVQAQQKRDISSLKRALSDGTTSVATAAMTDDRVEMNDVSIDLLLGRSSNNSTSKKSMTRSGSVGDIPDYHKSQHNDKYSNSNRNIHNSSNDSSPLLPSTPKTPLRVRLKRRILRQQQRSSKTRGNTNDTDEDDDSSDPSQHSSSGSPPKTSHYQNVNNNNTQVSNLQSFAASFSKEHGGSHSNTNRSNKRVHKNNATAQSDFTPGTNRHSTRTNNNDNNKTTLRHSSMPLESELQLHRSKGKLQQHKPPTNNITHHSVEDDNFSISNTTNATNNTTQATTSSLHHHNKNKLPPISNHVDDDESSDESSEENDITIHKSNSINLDDDDNNLRFQRQIRMGRRGEFPRADDRTNQVCIHVYDLIQSETIVRLPWGCDFPLGQCFNMVNSGLHLIGTGAYHVGVEVNGIEYAFGANNISGLSGVFTCMPRKSVGYDYRCTLDFGKRRTVRRSWISVPDPSYVDLTPAATPKRRRQHGNDRVSLMNSDYNPFEEDDESYEDNTYTDENTSLAVALELEQPPPPRRSAYYKNTSIPSVYREVNTFVEGHELMQQMAREYMGCDYDLLRKNCCTFARDTCMRLGVKKDEIPTWFLSLAEAGVATEDAVASMDANLVTPIKRILSGMNEQCGDDNGYDNGGGGNTNIHEDEDSNSNESTNSMEKRHKNKTQTHGGFEVIAERKRGSCHNTTDLEIVKIVESNPPDSHNKFMSYVDEDSSVFGNAVGIRHTLSWQY